MDTPPERDEVITVEKRQDRTYTFVVGRPGFFAKVVALAFACVLLALMFLFSLLIISIVTAVALMMLAYIWWARMRARRAMRAVNPE
jgi:Flp pilus assembly protein TadB